MAAHGTSSRWLRLAPWLVGLLALAALVTVVLHLGEIERFVAIARESRPEWLAVAVLAQLATYVCAAAVWHRTLQSAGVGRPLKSLVPLGVAKLFTDQAVPSGGISGFMLVMHGLQRRGVSAAVAAGALLVGVLSYYTAFLAAVILALAVLMQHRHIGLALLGIVGLFCLVAVAVPAAVLWLRHWGTKRMPAWLDRLPQLKTIVGAVAQAPASLVRSRRLLVETTLAQFAIFLLDALTLWLAFSAIGQPVDFWAAFATFVIASVAATIGIVPLGLGTFEAGSVGMLSLLGVPVEAALTATLLLRGLTFWLPMIPGFWLARRELGRH